MTTTQGNSTSLCLQISSDGPQQYQAGVQVSNVLGTFSLPIRGFVTKTFVNYCTKISIITESQLVCPSQLMTKQVSSHFVPSRIIFLVHCASEGVLYGRKIVAPFATNMAIILSNIETRYRSAARCNAIFICTVNGFPTQKSHQFAQNNHTGSKRIDWWSIKPRRFRCCEYLGDERVCDTSSAPTNNDKERDCCIMEYVASAQPKGHFSNK